MSYATRSDIESIFGTANVTRWSQLSPAVVTADTDRIARALAVADNTINDLFRGSKYSVPLTGAAGSLPVVVVDWAAKIAGVWLYNSRGFKDGATNDEDDKNRVRRHRTDAIEEIRQYLAGALSMDCTINRVQPENMQVLE